MVAGAAGSATRQGGEENGGLTLADAQEIINDFDTNGDGVLDISEFVAAFSKIGEAEAKHKAEMQAAIDDPASVSLGEFCRRGEHTIRSCILCKTRCITT